MFSCPSIANKRIVRISVTEFDLFVFIIYTIGRLSRYISYNSILSDISWCDMITGNGIKSLAEGCKKLQNFIAKGCMHIHDEGLLHLARNCKDLRKVNVQGCRNVQDEGVTRLAEACPNLEYLCVSNCSHLTDTSLLGIFYL